jgi:hypothetical protein
MTSSNLIRWSGLAALVGGVLIAVLDVAESVISGGQPESVIAGTTALIIVRIAFLVPILLILLGLVGLYARQAEQAGSLGLIAFLVAFSGTVMVFGLQWSGAFLWPWLADVAPELLDTEPTTLLVAAFMLGFVLLALGWLLFGLASLQARVLPRGAAVLLMVGAALLFVLIIIDVPGSGIVFGVALLWMGYALWSEAGQPALTAAPT